jgi:hypothetical protein
LEALNIAVCLTGSATQSEAGVNVNVGEGGVNVNVGGEGVNVSVGSNRGGKTDCNVLSPNPQSCNRKVQGSDNYIKGVYDNPTVECKH